MGVSPKVQPSFADIIHIANKKQDDTAPMCVPPKVQPTCADIIHTANKTLGYTAPMGVPPKVQPTFADIIRTANKKLGYTALMGVPPKVQPTFYFLLLLGEQGWCSGSAFVSHAGLPPMWPGFDSPTRCQMCFEFVVGSLPCSVKFFSGDSGFPLSSKTNISKFQLTVKSA